MFVQSENADKDQSIQALGVKISKKSEALSELSEQLDLFKAKDDENVQIINELKTQAKSGESTTDTDSVGKSYYVCAFLGTALCCQTQRCSAMDQGTTY